MNFIDSRLDRITMYRLLLYYLIGLLGAAMLLSALGYLSFNPLAIAISAAYLTGISVVSNRIFAAVFHVPSNPESSLITALILALIITPPTSAPSFVFLTAAAGLAIASKYILAIRGRHIFNPAAIAVALTAIAAGESASWWVGSAVLAPAVIIGGVLLVRKIRRGQMVAIFLLSAVATTAIFAIMGHASLVGAIQKTFLQSSLLFLAFVMLTEPLTSPGQASQQRWYAMLAGVLFPPQIHLLGLYSTPELVLVVSNIYAYIVNPKVKLLPKLLQKVSWGPNTADFVFALDQPISYLPGQYMEFTLPHQKPDERGSRRYFTLASSPTENTLRLGVKFYPEGSTFKQALKSMTATTPFAAAQLGGDFVLPDDPNRKLAFIAGGIGITPFRSMIKYLVDTNDHRSVTLLYSERDANALAYGDVFEDAQTKLQTKIVYTLTGANTTVPTGMFAGSITTELIQSEIPDFSERLFYISGPHSMVTAIRAALKSIGVPEHNIRIDFFPGYA
jgi:ferredoxin-NADP reductase/Na+-translocating ferredoxin:NAD+ oxidoreductase RnfD subunit